MVLSARRESDLRQIARRLLHGAVPHRAPVAQVTKTPDGPKVTLGNGEQHAFDAVVMACHADDALRMIQAP